MGPGSFDPGNEIHFSGTEHKQSASMGPGSFDPGNLGGSEREKKCKFRFNGAGVFRPRK